MHLELEDFNRLLSASVDAEERTRSTDHLLACDRCATRFRALNALAQEQRPASRATLVRYALGAAAVLFMAIYPYTAAPQQPQQGPGSLPEAPAMQSPSASNPAPASLNLLNELKTTHLQSAVADWGGQKNLIDIISLQNNLN